MNARYRPDRPESWARGQRSIFYFRKDDYVSRLSNSGWIDIYGFATLGACHEKDNIGIDAPIHKVFRRYSIIFYWKLERGAVGVSTPVVTRGDTQMNKLLGTVVATALMCSSAVAFSQGMAQSDCMQMQMKSMDSNADGMISKDEFMKAHEAMYDKMQKGSNGMVSMADMHMQMKSMSHCGMMKNGKMMNGDKSKMDQGMQGH